jgi:hypothetical protein
VVSGPVETLPDVTCPVDQLPADAVHAVALVEDQVRVDAPPLATVVGFAVREAVGTGGGGPDTVTVADALALPPGPVQVTE